MTDHQSRPGGTSAPKRVRKRGAPEWSKRRKARFLDHLAATCDVRASAAVVGVSPIHVYTLRRRDAAFAQAWSEALNLGYEMLETQLVGHAMAGGGSALVNGATDRTGPIDVDLALRLLARRDLPPSKRGLAPRTRPVSPEALETALARQIDAVARHVAAKR